MALLTIARRLRARAGWLILGVVLAAAGPLARAESAGASEYELKAVFLFNFAQFVTWPADAFVDAHAPLVIGVLGENPFGAALEEVVRGETVNGRPIVVQHYRGVEEIRACHILFVSDSERARLPRIVPSLAGRSILTVGDVEDFVRRGGMIRFVAENRRLHLRINLEAARAAHLTLSSKLLRPAEIVGAGKD
jgi:hypothetical protein